MKCFPGFILPCILVACVSTPLIQTGQSAMAGVNDPAEIAFMRTKMFAIPAEAEKVTSGYPKNDAALVEEKSFVPPISQTRQPLMLRILQEEVRIEFHKNPCYYVLTKM